ncbi:hypothetical protein TRFO_30987 [Tritrichomonas foetus]|uniref:Uncharacterized protein n=1 Tax=Tritrichomonas foetus TaxID=1144522 RepID=A0A1J4JTF4_9EUKA|nr:hypothetical protein TRFO_30987 [Tritrichomonas foetus]|eukprot:OHT02026.1 hypothetical protein TRFO_30987 [Tritrichomonas foetus]
MSTSEQGKSVKTIYRSTFSIIHDDEFRSFNTDEIESGIFKRDFVEWNDNWKQKPNDAFRHQFRAAGGHAEKRFINRY